MWLTTCVVPSGRIASSCMALPRRCMCGWKFSRRAGWRSTVKPSLIDTVLGLMSRLSGVFMAMNGTR